MSKLALTTNLSALATSTEPVTVSLQPVTLHEAIALLESGFESAVTRPELAEAIAFRTGLPVALKERSPRLAAGEMALLARFTGRHVMDDGRVPKGCHVRFYLVRAMPTGQLIERVREAPVRATVEHYLCL